MSTELSTLVTEINDELRKVGAGFVRVGELLHRAQAQLCDKWPEWVESNFAFSVSAANHHIQGWKSKVWVDDNAILLTALSRKNAEVSTPPELYVPEGGSLQDGGGAEEVETTDPIQGEIVADDPFDDGADYEAEEDSEEVEEEPAQEPEPVKCFDFDGCRKRAIKHAEALMRDIDDLDSASPHKQHEQMICECCSIVSTLKGWQE